MIKVQTSPRVSSGASASVSPVFSAPPTLGNAIIFVSMGGSITTVTDNYGNTYSLAKSQAVFNSNNCWVCPKITNTGAAFTVTGSGGAGNRHGIVIEVSGVGTPGLVVDKIAGNSASAAGASSGTTAALTANEVFLLTSLGMNTAQVSIGVSAGYTQEMEFLTTGGFQAAEIDSQILTGALGTTQSATWTYPTAALYDALIVAFKGSALPAAAEVIQTVIVM